MKIKFIPAAGALLLLTATGCSDSGRGSGSVPQQESLTEMESGIPQSAVNADRDRQVLLTPSGNMVFFRNSSTEVHEDSVNVSVSACSSACDAVSEDQMKIN